MTTDDYIDELLAREKGYQDDPRDKGNADGGATNWGITSKTWGAYKQFGRPATRAEIKAITRADATEFYRHEYFLRSPFQVVQDEALRVQLIDFAVNSGSSLALRWLQRTLAVPVTGVMDPLTVRVVNSYPGHLVNKALCCARLFMLDWATDPGGSIDESFEEGLESRALALSGFVRS